MHLQKFKSSAKGHMLKHYERAEGVNYSNKSIDPKKTHLNYNLAPEHGCSLKEFIDKRISELSKKPRKDAIQMCDWCVTLPQNVPKEESKDFFEKINDFFTERYGKENVVSAYVHMDETTPHMHFCFMPVKENRLCAKEVITRTELNKIHREAEEYLQKNGINAKLLNGACDEGALSVSELKTRTARLHKDYQKTQAYSKGFRKYLKYKSAKKTNKEFETVKIKQSCEKDLKAEKKIITIS